MITAYSILWLVPCLIGGALFCYKYLYQSKKLKDLSAFDRGSITLLRFLSLSILLFLLLKPSIEYFRERESKKKVLLIHDVSSSMDSVVSVKQDISKLDQMLEVWKDDLQIENLYFASDVSRNSTSLTFKNQTNFSNLSDYLRRNIGLDRIESIILISDGIVTSGIGVEHALDFGLPVNSFVAGDTIKPKDLKINDVYTNELVYSNQLFPIEVELERNFIDDESIDIKILQNDSLILDSSIFIKSEHIFNYNLLSNMSSVQKVEVSVESFNNESNQSNNTKTILIETINDLQQVVFISEEVHPDEAFFTEVIAKDPRFVLQKQSFSDEFDFQGINTVFISGLPQLKSIWDKLLSAIDSSNVSVLLLPHNNLRNEWLTDLFGGSIKFRRDLGEVRAFTGEFDFFELKDSWNNSITSFKPIEIQAGEIVIPTGKSLYVQSFQGINLALPLVHFTKNSSATLGIFLGEGYWRWRMASFVKNESEEPWIDFVKQVFKYLNKKRNVNRLQVKHQPQYFEGEEVEIQSFLYNDVFQLMPNQKINWRLLKNNDNIGGEFIYDNTSYRANLGSLEKGKYTLQVSVDNGEVVESYQSKISILENLVETQDLIANYNGLKKLSNNTGGVFINEDKDFLAINKSLELISKKKTILYSEKVLESIIELKFLLVLILSLLCFEWFYRKIKGVLL